jgi:LPXTG-site transpeptidase (sortase) family protein
MQSRFQDIFRIPPRSLIITLAVGIAVSLLVIASVRRDAGSPDPVMYPLSTGTRDPQIPTPLPVLDLTLIAQQMSTPDPAADTSGPARPARVQVERVGIDIPVLTVLTDQNGYIVTPGQYAGYWALSSTLDKQGNVVIVGHNRPPPWAVFFGLKDIEVGDEIVISDQYTTEYRYSVSEIIIIPVNQPESAGEPLPLDLIQPTDFSQLTLITCHPDPDCTSRLFVIALPAGS